MLKKSFQIYFISTCSLLKYYIKIRCWMSKFGIFKTMPSFHFKRNWTFLWTHSSLVKKLIL
jgi:hypothetical protein